MTRFRLDGKAALVTGGSSGIGAAIVRAYADQGARVVLGDVDGVNGERVAREIGSSVVFQRLDVADAASCEAVVANCRDRFGRLDVLVNSAGIGLVGTIEETLRADWDALVAVNITGVYLCSRAAVEQMLKQEPHGGVIIALASVAALVGLERRFAYAATKGAVLAMTRQLAVDYAVRGIRANAICPATIDSPFVQKYLDRFHIDDRDETIARLHARQAVGRMGRPEEVADLAVYLASDEAAFMTGAAIVLDGGLTAR